MAQDDGASPGRAPGQPLAAARTRQERRPATDAEARALASGLRLRIIRLCADEPLTNREIADALGKNPATVLHHVRTLVDTGFLEAGEVRRGRRGAREIPYRSTGLSWSVQLPPGPVNPLLEAFLEDIQGLDPEHHGSIRLGLRLQREDLVDFRRRLDDLLQEYAERPRDPDGEPWSIFVALHPERSHPHPSPDPTRPNTRS